MTNNTDQDDIALTPGEDHEEYTLDGNNNDKPNIADDDKLTSLLERAVVRRELTTTASLNTGRNYTRNGN